MSSEAVITKMDMSGDWTDRFIRCVQCRPALYNKHMQEYADRDLVRDLWSDVSENMIPEWQYLSSHDKILKGKEIQQRWRNIRTCFKRELNKQRERGPLASKRRKYIYYDQLQFLIPIIDDATGEENSAGKDDEVVSAKDNEPEEIRGNDLPEPSRYARSDKKPLRKTLNNVESLLNVLKEKSLEQIDEDKYFLLSLLPTFKKLTEEQKLDAKMEFMTAIKRIQSSHENI